MDPAHNPRRARRATHARPPADSAARLARLIDGFAGRRVLVVGDVILDRYIWGEVDRTSPEAPVPVVRMTRETTNLGGAANVVANLAALGARPAFVGVAGRDPYADLLRAHLAEIGVDPRGLIATPDRTTTVKTRVVSMGQQLLRVDREETGPLPEAVAARVQRRVERELERCEVVVLSDYDKGVLAAPGCRSILERARAAGRPIVVDPKGVDYAKYAGATVIKPNQKEAQAAAGVRISAPEDLDVAARKLLRLTRAAGLVISRGALGVAVFEKRRAPVLVPAQARSVYDINGCGDSLIATLSLALAAGASLPEAARLGNLAGSIAVGKFGAATVDPNELRDALAPMRAPSKLRTAAQLRAELESHRSVGRRVVFTNGCFDLLHLGHLKFLEQARAAGDVLVVALNTDRSVRAIRGAPRPVLGESERVALLSALDAVDFVTVFDEETPEALIDLLQPEVLVKGKGLDEAAIVGADRVRAYGGRVVSLPLLGTMTTEDMLERIATQSAADGPATAQALD